MLLSVVTVILAGLTVIADLGQPLRAIINLLRYARPQSPFFGSFTLVIAGYLFAGLTYLFLDGRRDAAICARRTQGALGGFFRFWAAGYQDTAAERQRHDRVTFWLGIATLPLLVMANSTLGLVFGIQSGRPGWFGTLQAPAFVVLGALSGVGLIAVLVAILRSTLHTENQLPPRIFTWLSNTLMVLSAAYLYFMVVGWLTASYAGGEQGASVTQAMLTGEYAWLYWASVAGLVLPLAVLFGQFAMQRFSVAVIVLSGLLVNAAVIIQRYLIVARNCHLWGPRRGLYLVRGQTRWSVAAHESARRPGTHGRLSPGLL